MLRKKKITPDTNFIKKSSGGSFPHVSILIAHQGEKIWPSLHHYPTRGQLPPLSLWFLSPAWQPGLQSPFCHFHFNYSRPRKESSHCTAHFQVSLERQTLLGQREPCTFHLKMCGSSQVIWQWSAPIITFFPSDFPQNTIAHDKVMTAGSDPTCIILSYSPSLEGKGSRTNKTANGSIISEKGSEEMRKSNQLVLLWHRSGG